MWKKMIWLCVPKSILLCLNPPDYKAKHLVVINIKFHLLTLNILGNINSIEMEIAAFNCK